VVPGRAEVRPGHLQHPGAALADDPAVRPDGFELDADGTITTAPRGHAKDWRPGIVTDIAEAAARYAEPQADALRLNLGGGL
jgi:hypothetical protein